MHIFYTPDILLSLEMPEEESLHCVKVLRLTEGEEVRLTNGKGLFFRAKIVRAHHKKCAVEIIEQWEELSLHDFKMHIAMAPTKNLDRIEWFAEKATEIGIDRLTFLKCRYSERKDLKAERIQKILVSAMKQSLKATLPVLDPLTDFAEFIKLPFDGQKFIAHCYSNIERNPLVHQYKKGEDVLVVIGPEGDFSEDEVNSAMLNGFIPVSLGNSRLRTETAALVACHTPHVINSL